MDETEARQINKPREEKSLFFLLAGALADRPGHGYNLGADRAVQEDFNLIEGLSRALEQDVANGNFDPHRLIKGVGAFGLVMSNMSAPRIMPISPNLPAVTWPLPGQAWVEPEVCDPRERLLARLVHLGADPWQCYQFFSHEKRTITFASASLFAGYHGVFRQALALPSPRPGDWLEAGNPSKLNLLQEAAFQGIPDIVSSLLSAGASVNNALAFASTGAVASHLIKAGADLNEKTREGTITERWISLHGTKVAREIIEATRALYSPQDLIVSLIKKEGWGPLSDAISNYPQWKQMTRPLGKLEVHLPVFMLTGACRHNDSGIIKNALRMLQLLPPSIDEVAPGLSEMSLVRLSLSRLLAEPSPGNSKGEDALTAKIERALSDLSDFKNQELLGNDATAFLGCHDLLKGSVRARRLAIHLASSFLAFPEEANQDIPTRFKNRSVESVDRLSRIAHIICSCPRGSLPQASWPLFFGYDQNSGIGMSSGDRRNDLFQRLEQKNPNEVSALLSGALWIGALAYWDKEYRYGNGKPERATLDWAIKKLEEGVNPGWSMADADNFVRAMEKQDPVTIKILPLVRSMAQDNSLFENTPAAAGKRQSVRL